MAKGKNDTSPAEDYIDQLQWRAQHHRRWVPARFEPKWKYKIVYRYPPVTSIDRILRLGLLIGVIFLVIWFLSRVEQDLGARIFFGSVFGLILLIVFFAVRDASDDDDKKSDDPD